MFREEKVEKALLELGVPHHIKGYKYIKESILMIVDDITYSEGITKDLYPAVADIYDATPSRVERAIRHAIQKTFINAKKDVIEKYFGNSIDVNRGTITNKHFLVTIADHVLDY